MQDENFEKPMTATESKKRSDDFNKRAAAEYSELAAATFEPIIDRLIRIARANRL